MIDTPPVAVTAGAPSTESLAFAHLLDGGNSGRIPQDLSRQTSSVGQVSLKVDDYFNITNFEKFYRKITFLGP